MLIALPSLVMKIRKSPDISTCPVGGKIAQLRTTGLHILPMGSQGFSILPYIYIKGICVCIYILSILHLYNVVRKYRHTLEIWQYYLQ